jgi:hypothetical protein
MAFRRPSKLGKRCSFGTTARPRFDQGPLELESASYLDVHSSNGRTLGELDRPVNNTRTSSGPKSQGKLAQARPQGGVKGTCRRDLRRPPKNSKDNGEKKLQNRILGEPNFRILSNASIPSKALERRVQEIRAGALEER